MAGKFKGKVGKVTKKKVASSTKKGRAKKSTSMVKRSPKLPTESLLSRIAALTSTSTAGRGVTESGSSTGNKQKNNRSDLVSSSNSAADVGNSFTASKNKDSSLLLTKKKRAPPQKSIIEKPVGRAALELVSAGTASPHVASRHASSREQKKKKTSPFPVVPNDDGNDDALDDTEEEDEEEKGTEKHKKTSSFHVDGVERVVPTKKIRTEADTRTTAEAVGLRLLHQALKTQGHNRVLPFQQRPDYEYRLRHVATLGVVELFRSLAVARKAGEAVANTLEKGENEWYDGGAGGGVRGGDVRLTEDKIRERKEIVSKEAFLAALRGSASVSG